MFVLVEVLAYQVATSRFAFAQTWVCLFIVPSCRLKSSSTLCRLFPRDAMARRRPLAIVLVYSLEDRTKLS